ncbi:hypothetical protein ACFX1Z_024647 [Malus domestica]
MARRKGNCSSSNSSSSNGSTSSGVFASLFPSSKYKGVVSQPNERQGPQRCCTTLPPPQRRHQLRAFISPSSSTSPAFLCSQRFQTRWLDPY